MPQAPAPKPIGSLFIELQSVDSTNNYARKQIASAKKGGINEGAEHGTVYFAKEQFSGRGQREKEWISETAANIIISVIVRPRFLSPSQSFQLSVCVAVSLYDFFKKYAGADTRIKWPNDLYWQDRKAGGILIESGPGWAILGIGVNINQTVFPPELPNPVSLQHIKAGDYDPVALAKELCGYLGKNYHKLEAGGFEDILSTYNSVLYKRGEKVRFRKGNRIFEGVIKGVRKDGKLEVLHAIEEAFESGEITYG